jgi:hypothetical protein
MVEINEDLQKVANSIISPVFCLLHLPVWFYDPTWKGNREGSLAGAEKREPFCFDSSFTGSRNGRPTGF